MMESYLLFLLLALQSDFCIDLRGEPRYPRIEVKQGREVTLAKQVSEIDLVAHVRKQLFRGLPLKTLKSA